MLGQLDSHLQSYKTRLAATVYTRLFINGLEI